jgi:hypothetical protein
LLENTLQFGAEPVILVMSGARTIHMIRRKISLICSTLVLTAFVLPLAGLAADGKKPITASATKKEETRVHEHNEHIEHNEPRRASLVPPPPPDTPSLMSGPPYGNLYLQQFLPVETMSPDALKQHEKDLGNRLQTAKAELKDKEKNLSEKTDRAKQFSSLFDEGVISRRELELSKEELKQSNSEIDTAKNKVSDLQLAITRVSDKLKALGKLGFTPGKLKNAAKSDSKKDKGNSKKAVAATSQASAKSASLAAGAVPSETGTSSTFTNPAKTTPAAPTNTTPTKAPVQHAASSSTAVLPTSATTATAAPPKTVTAPSLTAIGNAKQPEASASVEEPIRQARPKPNDPLAGELAPSAQSVQVEPKKK